MQEEKEQEQTTTQQYQRRNPVQQRKETKWGSTTLPIPTKCLSPQQDSSPSTSSTSTSLKGMNKKNDQLQEVLSKDDFNFDITEFLSKLKIVVPLSLLIEFPSIKAQLQELKSPKVREEMSRDPPAILNSRLIGRKGGSHAPFYVLMIVGNKFLHNALVDLGASTNVMPYSMMQSLNLQITRPYGNVCGLDSQRVQVMGADAELMPPLCKASWGTNLGQRFRISHHYHLSGSSSSL